MSIKPYLSLAAFALFCAFGTVLSAQTIGPGTGLGGATNLDTAGGNRLNIDDIGFQTLGAGTYDVLNFSYSASASSGNVQPFLAELTAPNTYTVLWVGPTNPAPGVAGIETELFALASEQFTLTSSTDVYAGFNVSNNIVFFANGGTTDHNGAAIFTINPGDSIGPFTNNDLPRQYAFEINVAEALAIPEPASIAIWSLIGLGLAGFGYYRIRGR